MDGLEEGRGQDARDVGRAGSRCAPGSTPTSARARCRRTSPASESIRVARRATTLNDPEAVVGGPAPALDRMSSVTVTDEPHADVLERLYGLADRVVDDGALANSVERFRERGIVLPTFAELADPTTIDPSRVGDADPQGPDARNLWRVHWYNDLAGGRVDVPEHVVLPPALTGVESPIIVVFGDRFPMITAHKVLAAYACLAPRIVTGQFDPTRHRAIWPSTGNYARGGIAISRIMASRGVAILPEGMSQERFDWLDRWCDGPGRRRDQDAGHGVQRQGDLRRLQRAGARPDERRAQPVLRVRQPPRPLRGHRAGRWSTSSTRVAGESGHAPRGVRVGDRVGRHDRRRRPPEGHVRHPHRRRRGAGVPDDAGERLRRAQHPGHRRQAHPADPQRDEHRRRRRHLRPGHRRARPAVQLRRRSRPAGRARASATT